MWTWPAGGPLISPVPDETPTTESTPAAPVAPTSVEPPATSTEATLPAAIEPLDSLWAKLTTAHENAPTTWGTKYVGFPPEVIEKIDTAISTKNLPELLELTKLPPSQFPRAIAAILTEFGLLPPTNPQQKP